MRPGSFLMSAPKARPRNAIRANALSPSLGSSKSVAIVTLKTNKGRRQAKAGVSIRLRGREHPLSLHFPDPLLTPQPAPRAEAKLMAPRLSAAGCSHCALQACVPEWVSLGCPTPMRSAHLRRTYSKQGTPRTLLQAYPHSHLAFYCHALGALGAYPAI